MKAKIFTLLFFSILLAVFSACPGSPETPKPDVNTDEPAAADSTASSTIQLNGVIYDTNGNPLKNVSYRQQSGGVNVTKSDGVFQLDIDMNNIDSRTVNFQKAGKETIRHQYDAIQYLDHISIYMEDQTSDLATVKFLGQTYLSTAAGSIPFENVRVYETKNRTIIKTNATGNYEQQLNHDLSNESMIYHFKYNGSQVTVEVKNLLGIKDSAKMDVVLATGSEPYPWKIEDN